MDFMMVISEEEWSIILLWAAEIFIEIVCWGDRNPIFGLVFLWAGAGIIADTVEKRPANENLIINLSTMIGIHTISMMTLTAYLIFEIFQPWYEPISFWSGGIFSKVNWAEMLTDVNWALNEISQYFIESS